MKIHLLLASVTLYLLAGCRETETAKPSEDKKLVPVSFSVSGFTQSFEKLSATSINQVSFPHTNYLVYDSQGKEIRRLKPTSDTFTDSLAKGTYTVVVTKSQGHLFINGYSLDPDHTEPVEDLKEAFVEVRPNTGMVSDNFYGKFVIKVEDQPIERTLKLERTVGKLELIIEDWEGDYETIWDAAGYSLDTGKPTGGSPWEGNGSYWQKTETPFSLLISIRKDGKIIERSVDNVIVHRNQKTIVRGKLFTKHANSFSVDYDTNWGTDSSIVRF